MLKFISCLLLAGAVFCLTGAPAPFQLPDELVKRAPFTLRKQLQRSAAGNAAYTDAAMKLLEDRIRKRMQLIEFSLNLSEAVAAMDTPDTLRASDIQIRLSVEERKKLFAAGDKMIQLQVRYNQSFRLRQEIIKLFRQCKPTIPDNRFHHPFFALLEFQHIYLEQQLNAFRKSTR